MEVNRNKAFTALRVSHAKSLQDITELKRLRESVGKNIREACLLVDGHERDLTEHCENLKKTRESFSQFERRLSNATLSSLENSRIRRKYWDESINSCSSGDENGTVVNRRRYNRPTSVIVKPRCSLSDNDDWKSRRYSYCSDAQSLSSAYSYSPKSQRSNKLRQIVVPIYEDSFDSGVSLQTTSPRTTASRSVSSDVHGYRSKNNAKSNGFQDIKSYSSRGSMYDSDGSSAVSYPRSLPNGETQRQKQRKPNSQQFILSQTWRSTPNLLEDETPKSARRRNGSLLDAKSSRSLSVSKRDLPSKASEWKSLPELGEKSQNSGNGAKKGRKRKGLVHIFRRITKSGEYVLKSNSDEKKKKVKSKRGLIKDEGISFPSSASPLGKTIGMVEEGKQSLHRVEIKLPKNGLYGFYVQKGFKKIKTGVFIGSFVNAQMKKLFAGVIREGDEVIEINSFKVDSISFADVLDILNDAKVLNLLIFPYVKRKK